MSDKKSSISSRRDAIEEKTFPQKNQFIALYDCDIKESLLLCCSKEKLLMFDMDTKIQLIHMKENINCATFIPNSDYIAFAIQKGQILVIWDYVKDKMVARIKMLFEIFFLKANRHCIALSSLQSLYLMHFPTLKPLYSGKAGNGLDIIFDVSFEGLTLAHNSQQKGQLVVRNFTNIQTVKTISQRISKTYKLRKQTITTGNKDLMRQSEEIKEVQFINAHKSNLKVISVSPNGLKCVTGSIKGTVLRVFDSLSGQCVNVLRVSVDLNQIKDICFKNDGTCLVCLSQNNQVNLFQMKMSQVQKQIENQRQGREIYQLQNPKSFYRFLGIFNSNFYDQYPFAYFKISSDKVETQSQDKAQVKISNTKQNLIPVIHEDAHLQELSQIQQYSLSFKGEDNRRLQLKQQKHQQHSKLHKKNSYTPHHHESKRFFHKTQSILSKEQKEINYDGTIKIDNQNTIRIFRNKYIYVLKYDILHGGQMVLAKAQNVFALNKSIKQL